MIVNIDNLYVDVEYDKVTDMPYSEAVDIKCNNSHLFGYILMPGRVYDKPHPCVLMFHGFPGYTTNNDLEHAFRRMGMAVIHINHRGAWGSGGYYKFSNLVDDAKCVVQWIQEDVTVKKYNIDKHNIFMVGHSMGGMTALNASAIIPYIKGVVAITPYNLGYWIKEKKYDNPRKLISSEGKCLRIKDQESLWMDAINNGPVLDIENKAVELSNKNIMFVGAKFDDVAPVEKMIDPLWKKINEIKNDNVIRKYVILNTNHGLCGQRIVLSKEIAEFISKLLQ